VVDDLRRQHHRAVEGDPAKALDIQQAFMNSVLRIFAFGLVTLVPVRVTGQTSSYADSLEWARYQPGSLGAIIRQKTPVWLSGIPAKGTTFAVGARYPTRARVVFLGKTRPMPSTRTQFIGAWVRSQLRMDSASVLALYKREVLVREGKRRFWLPVQEVVWANNKELWVRNRPIVVLVQLVGARVVDRIPDWVFLVMTVEPPPDA